MNTAPAASAATLRALVFDVFGTLVDWRTSIAREARAAFAPHGVGIDGLAFADAWRAQYQPAMEAVRSGARPYVSLDSLHRENLDVVLRQTGLDALAGDTLRRDLNLAWHRLDAWPDVTPGLQRLRQRFWLAPCSNGNIVLMADLARRNGWVWDAVLGADLARAYKPQPAVYLAAVSAFGCEPGEVLMVAAHSSDLAAATAAGLRTAFVARPDEPGPGLGETAPAQPVDWTARSLLDLADQLGAPAL